MGSVRRGASARGQHVARAAAAPDGARAALAHGAEGLLLGLVFARPRLPHRLLHSPRRDTARRLLPLSEEPAARGNSKVKRQKVKGKSKIRRSAAFINDD